MSDIHRVTFQESLAAVTEISTVENKTVIADGRLIQPMECNFNATREWASKQETSKNAFVAVMQKAAFIGMTALSAVSEFFANIGKMLFNGAIAAPTNFVYSLIKSEKVETPAEVKVEETPEDVLPQVPAEPEMVELLAPRTRVQQFKDGAAYYTPNFSNFAKKTVKVAADLKSGVAYYTPDFSSFAKKTVKVATDLKSGVASQTANALNAIKEHPYKTAAVVGGLVTLGAAGYAGYTYFGAAAAPVVASCPNLPWKKQFFMTPMGAIAPEATTWLQDTTLKSKADSISPVITRLIQKAARVPLQCPVRSLPFIK